MLIRANAQKTGVNHGQIYFKTDRLPAPDTVSCCVNHLLLMKALPGTPFNNPKIPADQLEILKRQYGLDKPVWIQYLTYMVGITHGDFGMSYQFPGQTVSNLIVSRLGPSLQIGAQAMVLGTLIGIVLGAIAAIRKNTAVDAEATIFAILGRSIPNFVFAALLQLFAYKTGAFPVALWGGFSYSILPTIALAIARWHRQRGLCEPRWWTC